ncbi:MAG: tRNA pseudouridine(55) synthase TruB [Dehalococcoidia bacterium]|nr:MAG: tRNA pseudouridine(55) synthase TruB [Dehalococcoidia bacterium]
MAIDGILNLDKPRGKTSFEVVAAVRRLSGERRVGHGGTLDPEATGVLPIYLGQGTRVVEFLAEAKKTYRAEIELGISTDTYDATGKVTGRGDTSALTREEVEAAAASFSGLVEQIPPMYSAVKYQGVPLYRWARAGVELPRTARKVEFFRIEILEWQTPLLTLEVECSKGAYIRSLAHDLGEKLGCGAHLRNLVRLSSGPFHISDAVTMSRIEDAFREGWWSELIYPIDVAVLHLPAMTVGDDDERAIINGRPLWLAQEEGPSEGVCRAYSHSGRFVAILRYDEARGCWQPRKVFAKRSSKA